MTTVSQRAFRSALWIFGILFCIFLIGPILAFVPMSFNDVALLHYPIETLSLRWYRDLFQSSEWRLAFFNSLFVASLATLLATILGVCAAFGLWRGRFPGKNVIMVVIMTPMIVPSVIGAISMYFSFAQIGMDYTFSALILAHTAMAAPIVVLTVSAVLARFDANLLRAAASLGAHPILAFRRVMLPLIMPGVVSGAIFAFAISLDDVVVALFLAGPSQRTLPVQMYMRSSDLFDLVTAAAAAIMFVAALAMMAFLGILRKRDRLAPGAGTTSAQK